MIVSATDLKNNLGKYLRYCTKEDITITSNGRRIATLRSYEKETSKNKRLEYIDRIGEKSEAFNDFPRKISYEEFRNLTEDTEERYEYIDGQVYLIASPKTIHQRILGELHIILYNYFKDKKCITMLSPYDITLKRNNGKINVVEPDLVVICDLEENINDKDYYMGTPTLAIEIISESTRAKDTIKKLDLYMSTGIKEYWIINPINSETTIHFFKNKDINKNSTYKKNETAPSYIFPGLKVRLKDIFK